MKPVRCNHAILTLCLAFVAALLVVAPPAGAQEIQPSAVVDEPVFDAGKVSKGKMVVHDFTIRNAGQAPLQITEVRPACGCTVADYDETIAPGETGKIHAELDTTDFAGGISKGLTVFTNDPENPRLVLTMKANVEPHVYLRPGFARFVQTEAAEAGSVQQLIFTDDFDQLKILDVKSPYPFVEVSHRLATEEEREEMGKGPQYVVTVTLNYGEAPVGALAEYVRLKVNHPDQDEVSIPVSGFVRPMVVVTPDRADLGSIAPDEGGVDVGFVLKNYANENLKVEFEDSTVPGATAEVEEVEEGRQFRVMVKLPAEMPKGDFDGVVRLKTDHPKKPIIEIPLSGKMI